MQRVILVPDSFKGTLTAMEFCAIVSEATRRHSPDCEVLSVPVADGGEGTVDCFLTACGGTKYTASVQGPYGEPLNASYAMLPGGTAVIEMASCAGLPLVGERRDPLKTTTYGVGQLIAHAVENGAKAVILGLGGSATNDCGCGAAAALGVRFTDASGKTFVPVGGTLKDIAQMDLSGLLPAVKDIPITAICDIDNPMYGASGASAVFGPQKGASPEVVQVLDAGVKHFTQVVLRDLGTDLQSLPGSGAAGAMGGGAHALLGATLKMGIETVLDTVGFDDMLVGADMVITGEGQIDSQSLRGKVVMGVAGRAARQNVPVVALVGAIGENISPAYQKGLTAVFSINPRAEGFETAKHRAAENLALTADNLARLLAATK